MKKIAFILSIALLGLGFTNPIVSKKAPDAFTDIMADFYFNNEAASQTCSVWGDSGPSYQMIEYIVGPSEYASGAWVYDVAWGIDVNIYPHNSAPGTYAHVYGMSVLRGTIDISTGGVLYNFHLSYSQVYGTGWGVIIDNNP